MSFGRGKLFDFAAVDSFDKGVASWEVAIEGGVADVGSACGLRVGGGDKSFFFGIRTVSEKHSATGEHPRLSFYIRDYPRFIKQRPACQL